LKGRLFNIAVGYDAGLARFIGDAERGAGSAELGVLANALGFEVGVIAGREADSWDDCFVAFEEVENFAGLLPVCMCGGCWVDVRLCRGWRWGNV